MQSMRARLSLSYLLVLIIGMLLAGVLAWLAVEQLYIGTQRENLLAQARLMAAALEGSDLPTEPAQPYSQTSNVAPGIHTRLLSEGGAVVIGLPFADEFTQAPAAEGYASVPTSELVRRPEIETALNGKPATAIRSVLNGQRVLYAAAPVYSPDGVISGVVYIATPLPRTGLPTNLILQLVGAIVLAILLATIFGGLVARKISHPLEGLASAAVAIASGDLKKRVDVDSGISEIQSLSQTFNEMAEDLRKSDEAKKAFIADVTHELRTPLTVIKGTIETLEDGALDDVEGRQPLLTSMHKETDRLIRLVNELLVLTRADAGSLQLNMQLLNLGELARRRCDVFSNLAARADIRLKVDEFTAGNNVLADPDRLSQVIDNLLDNAIRHSPRGAELIIRILQQEGEVACSVIDRGIGILQKHMPFIFERFYRVDSSRSRVDGGTGLGLAIAKALVNAHGGTIRAESTEGQGTTITFLLPIASRLPAS